MNNAPRGPPLAGILRVVSAIRIWHNPQVELSEALGRLVSTVETGVELNKQGFDSIRYSGNVWMLHNAFAEAIPQMRAGCWTKGGKP